MSSTTARTDLPAVIAAYLDAHIVRDADRAIPLYHADATVTDEGKTYTGREEIRGWLQRAASEYTYTTTTDSPSLRQIRCRSRFDWKETSRAVWPTSHSTFCCAMARSPAWSLDSAICISVGRIKSDTSSLPLESG